MSETQAPPAPKDYPESWDDHEKAQAESKKELKIADGGKVRMHIISGPLLFREDYVVIGKKEDGSPKKKRIALPFGANLPGYDLKVKYMMEVVILDGAAKGQHKLYVYGKKVAEGLAAVKAEWGSTRVPDIVLSRKGSTMNDTVYTVTAAPSTVGDVKAIPVEFNLEHEVRFSNKADIDSLPPPVHAGPTPDSLSGTITPAQEELINSICKQKDIPLAFFKATLERKFPGKTLAELTVGEASAFIGVLQAV